MPKSFDLILRAGMVATPGGVLRTDIGVRDERIAAFGDLGGRCRTLSRLRRAARLTGGDRHTGALPRARTRTQGRHRDRHRRRCYRRRHRRLGDAEYQAADGRGGRSRGQAPSRRSSRLGGHRLLYRRDSGEHPRTFGLGAAARMRRREDVHGQLDRDAAGRRGRRRRRSPEPRQPPGRRSRRGRDAPARALHHCPRRRRSVPAPRMARRPNSIRRDPAVAGVGRRCEAARARPARLDGGRDGIAASKSRHRHRRGDATASQHGGARLLRGARELRADEPANPRGAAPARVVAGGQRRAGRLHRLRSRAAYPRGEEAAHTRRALPECPACRPWCR